MCGRQRQYFEQKRRQQQQPELQYQDDVAGGQASQNQQRRSLDVLNINDLATPNNHHSGSTSKFPISIFCGSSLYLSSIMSG
jgi:hypothetical protein